MDYFVSYHANLTNEINEVQYAYALQMHEGGYCAGVKGNPRPCQFCV